MALWGNNDNLVSNGTVSLNYGTKVVTGTGTTFGTVGFGVTGDIIRFGARGPGVGQTYFGDAVIVSIANTQSLTIGSTAGLNGEAMAANIPYHLSQLPKSTVLDHTYDADKDSEPTYKTFLHGSHTEADDQTLVNEKHIGVSNAKFIGITTNTKGKDALLNGGNTIEITAVGFGTGKTTSPSVVGFSTVYVVAPPGITVNNGTVDVASGGSTKPILVTSIGSTSIGLAATISAQINAGTILTFRSDSIIALASTVSVGIATGDVLTFQKLKGGYDKVVYGIGDGTSQSFDGSSTKYRTSGSGWVGVTTYLDCHGNLRVKHETLVAMGGNFGDATAGIQTGVNGILYPSTN